MSSACKVRTRVICDFAFSQRRIPEYLILQNTSGLKLTTLVRVNDCARQHGTRICVYFTEESFHLVDRVCLL